MDDSASGHAIAEIGSAVGSDSRSLGTKGWYLDRLATAGFLVPPAFVVTTEAYRDILRSSGVADRLARIWATAAHASPDEIPPLARQARHLFAGIEAPSWLRRDVESRLAALADLRPPTWGSDELRVAVRSSAPPGSVSGNECAGVHATHLGVVGLDRVLARIRSCWASSFGERALMMRSHGLGDDAPALAVVVQTMVDAERSGIVMPTARPEEVVVEATFGLGEPIVSGAVEPDRYTVDRATHEIASAKIGRKEIVLRGRDDVDGHQFASPDHLRARVLTDEELAEICTLGDAIDGLFDGPHEVEWSIDAHGLHPLQARPATTAHHFDATSLDGCVSGAGIGEGWATGDVRRIVHDGDLDAFRPGEILVAPTTHPDWLPLLQRAAALVIDDGDETCHTARVAIEEGVPAIVGTGDATSLLETGMSVTVDARRGIVFPVREPAPSS